MDEDRLSPDLGRLIDRAKEAGRSLGAEDPLIEAVALLVDSGDIYAGATLRPDVFQGSESVSEASEVSAAHVALQKAAEAGAGEVLAAAVAAPYAVVDTVPPSVQTYERLVGLDPELPLVMKQHGRWVMLPADRVSPGS